MNKVVGLTALVLVAVVGVWWFGFRGDGDETVVVRRGSIDVTIQTIGRVQSTGATTIRAQSAGEVAILAATAGDTVSAGDIVVQLSQDPFERAVAAAEHQLEEAEFALQIAQREADDSPDDDNRSFAVVRAAREVEAAALALEDAEIALQNASIRSPEAGTLLEVLVRQGDLVNSSQPVTRIFSRDDLEIIANVDELDLVNIEREADVIIRFDAFPTEEVPGTVVDTAPQATEQGGATVFATTISMELPDDLDVRPGMNADVTIVTDARDNVLLISQRAIRTVGERTFVNVVTEDGREEREIVTGYRSGGDVEVVSGLSEGDFVAIP